MVRQRGLEDGEGGDFAVVVVADVRTQSVHARGFQPLGRPFPEVPAARLLQLNQQIGEFGIGPRMLAEVLPDALHEFVLADPGHELLQDGGALRVGNTVEVDLYILEVVDRSDDGVRGGQLILAVCPGFL